MNTNQKSYLSSKHIDIYYDLNFKIGYAIWKDFCNEEDYKNALLAQVKMARAENLKFLLCDIRNFKGTTVANMTWTTNEAQPQLYNSTVKKLAYIVGDSVFGNFTLTVIKKKFDTDGVLVTNAFRDYDSAIKWLKEEFAEVA